MPLINFQRPSPISYTSDNDIIITGQQIVTFTQGSGSWNIPFAVSNITAAVVGGGGGGGVDEVDNSNNPTDGGGGGGGGAWATRTWYNLPYGGSFSYIVGKGGRGGRSDSDQGVDGEDSRITAPTGEGIRAKGGGGGGTSREGDGGGYNAPGGYGIDGQDGEYAFTEKLPAFGGYGGGAAGSGNGGYGGSLGNSYGGPGGDGVNIFGVDQNNGGRATSSNDGRDGGLYGGGGGGGAQGDDGGDGADGLAGFIFEYDPPFISSIGISTQQSVLGIPDDRLTITWQVTNTSHLRFIEVDNGNETVFHEIVNLGGVPNSNYTFNSGLQSDFSGGNSPATMTYRIEAVGPGGKVSSEVNGYVYNDDIPDPFSVPDQVDVEPNLEVIIGLGTIQGIDMKTSITASAGLQFSLNGQGWQSNGYINPGDGFRVRSTALGFNTNIAGVPMGKQNTKSVFLKFGEPRVQGLDYNLKVDFDIITRAPETEEVFNFGNNPNAAPYPKVDTTDVEPTEYLKTLNKVTINDVELTDPYGVPIIARDKFYSPPNTLLNTDVFGQNRTEAQVNRRRIGQSENDTWIDMDTELP